MSRQKLVATALALPLLGIFLLQSPLIRLFPPDASVGGVPLQVVYIFSAWIALIIASAWLARLLGRQGGRIDDENDLGEDTPP